MLGGVCYAIRFRCLRCLRVATRRGRVCGDRAARGRLRCPRAAARPGWVVWRPFGMREAVVPEGGGRAWVGGVASLRHAGGCGVRGRRRGVGVFGGDRAVRGRLRCLGVATRPGWVVWRSFGMREAAVPEGGGRAWPGFEPTRRAEGSRRGRRAGGLPPSGTESSRGGGLPPSGTESSWGGRRSPAGTESGGSVATGVPRGPS